MIVIATKNKVVNLYDLFLINSLNVNLINSDLFENINKKYHWVAYVKPVAGYPIRTYRGVVYGKDGASKFGTSSNFIFENDCPFPLFSISNGTPGLFKNAEEGEAKGIPTHLDVSWLSYVEKCQYLLEDQPLDSVKIAELLKDKVYTLSLNENDTAPKIEEYNISVGLAPGGVVFVWLHNYGRVVEVGRYQAKKTEDIHFVTKEEASQYYKRTGDVVLDEHTIENRDYAIKLGMPKKKILMKHNECGTPVTESSVKEDDILKIPYGIWDTYRKEYNWHINFDFPNNEKIIFVEYDFYNGEKDFLLGEVITDKHPQIPDIFRWSDKVQKNHIPKKIYFHYMKDGNRYSCFIGFNEEEIFNAFEKIMGGDATAEIEMYISLNHTNIEASVILKNKDKEVTLLNNEIKINEWSRL